MKPRHPRVVHIRSAGWHVYIGRLPGGRPNPWANPYPVAQHGPDAMRLYLERLEASPELVARARRELAGQILGCWCAPRLCHGEALARLADGEPLEAIRAELLEEAERLRGGPETLDLFGGQS